MEGKLRSCKRGEEITSSARLVLHVARRPCTLTSDTLAPHQESVAQLHDIHHQHQPALRHQPAQPLCADQHCGVGLMMQNQADPDIAMSK